MAGIPREASPEEQVSAGSFSRMLSWKHKTSLFPRKGIPFVGRLALGTTIQADVNTNPGRVGIEAITGA